MDDLQKAISDAATKKVRLHERQRRQAYDETVRRDRRAVVPGTALTARTSPLWNYDASHNPFHVRARAASIAHAINNSIRGGAYAPLPPAGFSLSSAGKRSRTVTAFSIADEVVSKRLYGSLLNKNRARLSARSYAYRRDLKVHDAIAHMQSEWAGEHRLFVAQYDFSDYFGSIDHDHVWATVASLGLAITRTERRLLEAFMRAPLPTIVPATMPQTSVPRTRGVHQGTTVSLLLANIAATPLDREFERLGVSFTRYADDIVIWSRDYTALNRAVDELHRFAERSGCSINQEKSEGVQLLTSADARTAEFRQTHGIEFLSHRLGLRTISLGDRALAQAKIALGEYIYNHLLREPLNRNQNPKRLHGGLDRDYLALLSQVRRYLYGNLSETQLRRLLRGPIPPKISLGGLLGRHPLVNDMKQLSDFDAWLSTQVWLALRKRERLLNPSVSRKPAPWGYSQAQLAQFVTRSTRGRRLPVDGRLPSAVRMSELVHRAVRAHGTRVATHTPSLYAWS